MTFNAAMWHGLGMDAVNPFKISLTSDGVDLVSKVPVESIYASEAGPGAVSSLRFDVWDTDKTVTIGDGARISGDTPTAGPSSLVRLMAQRR